MKTCISPQIFLKAVTAQLPRHSVNRRVSWLNIILALFGFCVNSFDSFSDRSF